MTPPAATGPEQAGGRLRVIATVQDPAVVRTILAHVGRARSTEAPGPGPFDAREKLTFYARQE